MHVCGTLKQSPVPMPNDNTVRASLAALICLNGWRAGVGFSVEDEEGAGGVGGGGAGGGGGGAVAGTHLLSAIVRMYSLVAPCRLPDLTSLALLGSVSGQRGLSRGLLPGYKTVSKWRLQLQDSTPPPLTFTKISHHSSHLSIFGMLSPVYCHAGLPPWHLLVKSDSSNLCFVTL